MPTPAVRSRFLVRLVVAFGLVAGFGWYAGSGAAERSPAPAVATEFEFHRDHIIGTSFDLRVLAPDEKTADAAELTALDEIERLRKVFSTYDADSEISKLNGARGPVRVSPEMAEVLEQYAVWQRKSGGAFNSQVGELVRVWKAAEKANREPDAETLARITADLKKPGWTLDANTNTLTRHTDQPLDLNSVAKGYMIRKAALAVQKAHPAITGLLVNLGGDIFAWGEQNWAVGVQDPTNHFDNAKPLAGLRLKNQGVSTSGSYQRGYTIEGKRYSHIFDPRTGRPAEGVVSATVIAQDNAVANALATTLCVLTPEEGLKLIATVDGAACLIIDAGGKQHRSPNMGLFEVAPARVFAAQDKKDAPKGEAWPAGYQVTIAVELPKIDATKRYRKPYTAVWIEDDKGKAVKTLAVWGNAPKYLKDLREWWKIGKNDNDLVKAVARATRGPGKYDLVWDGKDDKGNLLPQGTYTVRVEVHREFGADVTQTGKIECKDKAATVKMEKNAETAETVVEFKKAEKK